MHPCPWAMCAAWPAPRSRRGRCRTCSGPAPAPPEAGPEGGENREENHDNLALAALGYEIAFGGGSKRSYDYEWYDEDEYRLQETHINQQKSGLVGDLRGRVIFARLLRGSGSGLGRAACSTKEKPRRAQKRPSNSGVAHQAYMIETCSMTSVLRDTSADALTRAPDPGGVSAVGLWADGSGVEAIVL